MQYACNRQGPSLSLMMRKQCKEACLQIQLVQCIMIKFADAFWYQNERHGRCMTGAGSFEQQTPFMGHVFSGVGLLVILDGPA